MIILHKIWNSLSVGFPFVWVLLQLNTVVSTGIHTSSQRTLTLKRVFKSAVTAIHP
jgi:hypothetical protein